MSGTEIKTSVVIDLAGNLDRQLKRNTASIKNFSRNGTRDLDRLDKKTKVVSNRFSKMGGRILGAATAYKAFRAASKVIDFDARVTQLQTSGNYSDQEIATLKNNVFQVANQPDVRLSPDQLLAGLQKIIELTGDKKFADDNLRNVGLTARATGSTTEDVASVIATLHSLGLKTTEQVNHALDGMVKISEAGAVGFKDIAKVGPKLLTITSGLGVQGEAVSADLTALAQIARRTAGSAEEATTASNAFGLALLKGDIQEKLASRGVDVRNEDGSFKPLSDLIVQINDAADRDMTKLSSLFDSEALRVFKGLNTDGGTEALKELSSIRGDGSEIQSDARKNAATAKASMQAISNKGAEVSDSIFSEPTKNLAHAFDVSQGLPATTTAKNASIALLDTLYEASRAATPILSLYDRVSERFQTKPEDSAEPAVQRSHIELEIKSDKPVVVNSITSQNLDVDIDTGPAMSSN